MSGEAGGSGGDRALGVVGDLVQDIVVWLAEPLRRGSDTEATVHRRRGGSAANVAAFAARLWPTRFIGSVGTDATGDALAGELGSHGVDVRVQRSTDAETGSIVVLIDADGERSMLPDRGAAALLRDVDPASTDGVAHLHVPAYAFAAEPLASTAYALLERVRAAGGTTSLDASSTGMLRAYGRDRFRRLVEELAPTQLFANAEEAELLDVRSHPGNGTTVLVKDGEHPTTALVAGAEVARVSVTPVAGVRDRTGAGDAFAAGFLTATLDGADLETACVAGHVRAALVLQSPGATLVAPSEQPPRGETS